LALFPRKACLPISRNPDTERSHGFHAAKLLPAAPKEIARVIVSDDIERELLGDHWEALKALRLSALDQVRINVAALQWLVANGLAVVDRDQPRLTAYGRSVLLRGSPSLLQDLAA